MIIVLILILIILIIMVIIQQSIEVQILKKHLIKNAILVIKCYLS